MYADWGRCQFDVCDWGTRYHEISCCSGICHSFIHRDVDGGQLKYSVFLDVRMIACLYSGVIGAVIPVRLFIFFGPFMG
jgi:hypothetical protein